MSVGNIELERAAARPDPLRPLAERLPRPLRFLGVGGLGLITDLCVFTILIGYAAASAADAARLACRRDAGHLAAQPRAHLRPSEPPAA